MDRIANDSDRERRSNLYGAAYDVARDRIGKLMVGGACPDPASVMRRLVASVSRELGDDGSARSVIGWAAEDAIAGWGPRMTIRFSPKFTPRDVVEPPTHDGTLGRQGELRGRPADGPGDAANSGDDVMILDGRDSETPRRSVERRVEQMLRGRPSRGASPRRGGVAAPSSLRIQEPGPTPR